MNKLLIQRKLLHDTFLSILLYVIFSQISSLSLWPRPLFAALPSQKERRLGFDGLISSFSLTILMEFCQSRTCNQSLLPLWLC